MLAHETKIVKKEEKVQNKTNIRGHLAKIIIIIGEVHIKLC